MTTGQLYDLYLKHPSIKTDTRSLLPGDLFFALKGPTFNGNAFAEKQSQMAQLMQLSMNPYIPCRKKQSWLTMYSSHSRSWPGVLLSDINPFENGDNDNIEKLNFKFIEKHKIFYWSKVNMKSIVNKYIQLLNSIGITIEQARQNAIKDVNTELVKANWEIGRHIVEYEQHGQERAEYGSKLLTKLSKDLKQLYGRGFGRRNILDMRRFYLGYQKWQTVSAKLSWSHYIALVAVSDDNARKFYEKHTLNENLSVRELERQIDSSLF